MNKSFMTFMCTGWDMGTVAAKAAAFGYEGVELRVDSGHAHGLDADSPPEKIKETKQLFADADVAVCCIATSCRFASSDAAERQEQVDRLLAYFDVAEALGAPTIRIFGGMPSEGSDHETGKRNVVDALRQVAENVAGRPVVAALETHDDYRPGGEVADVIRQVHSPNVQANYDIMHPVNAGEPLDVTYDALRSHVVHTHIHDGTTVDGKLQVCHLGEGDIPNADVMKRLLADGYEGFFSLEYIGADWDKPDELLPQFMDELRRAETST